MMTSTLNDMTAKKKPDPSAEEIATRELVRPAREKGPVPDRVGTAPGAG